MGLPNNINTADLTFVGAGNQGKVYLIDQTRCIKVYNQSKFFKRELSVLQKTKGEPRFPALYNWGDNYMIREYISGIDLETHLKTNPLTESISRQLIDIIESFKRLGFKRLDTRLTHIIITPKGELRIIDPTNAMNKTYSYPRRMMGGLANLGYKNLFLEHTKKINPPLYEKWHGGEKTKNVAAARPKHKRPENSLDKFFSYLFE